MENTDIVIIGAGVVGLSIARQLGKEGREVVVVERHPLFGQETSSRNSEVIHSGLYYPKGSLKAGLCLEGCSKLYQLCQEQNIPYKKTGKLIVAVDNDEVRQIESLLIRGQDNGVQGLKMLTSDEVAEAEPQVKAVAGLYVPSAGIIDTHQLMKYYEFSAQEKGVIFAYGCEITNINKKQDSYEIDVCDADQEYMTLNSSVVINSGGLCSHLIAQMAGIDIDAVGYNVHFCKGEYFRVAGNKSKFIKHLVYPVPQKAGLGIHTVPDLQGQLKLGPNIFYVDEIDYDVDPDHKREFYESAKKYLPFIELDDLSPDIAGMRPKLQGPGEEVKDFIICSEEDKGYPGFINLIGIESPGLTSAPAIAGYVGNLLY